MKNVTVVYQGAKYYGGVETYLYQLFENIDRSNVSLSLISLGEWELTDKIKKIGYPVTVIPSRWYNPLIAFKIATVCKKSGVDLITSQGMVANFYARLASLKSRIPSLVTIHSDYKYDFKGYKKILYAISFWAGKSLTKKYITVSDFLKKETEKFGVAEGKITVVYNGVADIGEQKKKRSSRIIIGSIARLHHKKGYSMLLDAVSRIRELDWELYIWGEGEERPKLEKKIKNLGLRNRVFLPGFTNNVAQALLGMDIYVQPSLEEGFGITVAEAMYAAKTVIVTPAGSLPELITDGKTGLIAANISSEALSIELKEVIETAPEYGATARKEALSRFGIDVWIKNLTKIYMEVSK